MDKENNNTLQKEGIEDMFLFFQYLELSVLAYCK